MQDYYSLLYRENEREMIPYCEDAGAGLIPYSPLGRGLLARPYNSVNSLPTTRQQTDWFSEFMLGKTTIADIEIIGRVEELAKQKGVSMVSIVLSWCFSRAVIPIVGLGTIGTVDQAAESLQLTKAGLLTKEDIDFLEEKYAAKSVLNAG
jgi:aryl-alcohol dehydrogenase-like predicted oxidoreductase